MLPLYNRRNSRAKRLESFELYRISNPEHIMGGAGLLKQGLVQLLVERVRATARKEYSYCADFKCLEDPIDQWCHRQYRCVATILDLSTNTVKRLFGCKGYADEQQSLSAPTQRKIAAFLQTEDWEKEALLHILRKGLIK